METFKLIRNDGKIIEPIFYENNFEEVVEVLDIKNLKFEGKNASDISKSDIRNIVFKEQDILYLKNKLTNISALLPKKHLAKIISTIFNRNANSKYTYLKKEIISNIDIIFYHSIPILKHAELKSKILYNNQIIHRFASLLKIGGINFLIMITVKERTDFNDISIDQFSIYDLYSETINKKPFDSSSTASVGHNPMTTCSQCQTDTYIIYDLIEFVKVNLTKVYNKESL